MSFIEIQTTQNIHLEYETASIGERFVAALIDRLLLFFWLMIWGLITSFRGFDFSVWLGVLMGAPVLFYYLLFELLFNGRSAGKIIMSIRVAKIDGTAPSFGDYFLRWIFRLIENIPMAMGGLAIVSMIFTPKCQRLGDLAAKTCVIRTKKTANLAKVPEVAPDYVVTYHTATLLNNRDVALIAQIISNPATLRNRSAMKKLADKVKTITQTTSNSNDLAYLRKILADYNYLSGKM